MSGTVQRRKGLKRKHLICNNVRCFATKSAAKLFIERQKNKGVRGSKTLEVFKCEIHSNKQGDTYHVRQRRRH